MPYFFYGFDWTYLVLVLPCMIFAMIASSNVNKTFQKYATQYSQRRLTGAEAASVYWHKTASPAYASNG